VRLTAANFADAKLRAATFNDARLQGARLSRAELIAADLNNAHMQGVDSSGAILAAASLEGAYLQDARLDNSNIKGASFVSASLQGASLKCVTPFRTTFVSDIDVVDEQQHILAGRVSEIFCDGEPRAPAGAEVSSTLLPQEQSLAGIRLHHRQEGLSEHVFATGHEVVLGC
jgi:Pentapeptide repeats (8 copies)